MYGWMMASALSGVTAEAQEPEVAKDPRVRISARGGYTNYSRLHFVTGEGEVAVRVASKIHAVAGVAVYGVQLTPPPQRQLETGKLREWAAFAPIHVGARYQTEVVDNVAPFVGIDVLTGRYYQGEDGGAWAFGGRLRGGLDWMFTDIVGLHANLGLGVWTGDRWSDLETGLPDTGLLPQLSVGITVAP